MSDEKPMSPSGAFVLGVLVAIWGGAICVGIGSTWMGSHDVGYDQRVCMTIQDTEASRVKACATGAELTRYLRHREGIGQ